MAYAPKSETIYQSKPKSSIVASLPFKVNATETVYAGIIELSSEGLDLAIFSDEN